MHYRLEHLSGAFVAVTYGLALVAVGVRPLLSSALGGTDPLSLFSTAFPPTTFDLAHLCLFSLLGCTSALALTPTPTLALTPPPDSAPNPTLSLSPSPSPCPSPNS